MIKINDGTLLKEVIGFCDAFNEEAIVKQYKSNGSEVELDYPLDGTVKSKLEILKQRGICLLYTSNKIAIIFDVLLK